MTKLIYSNIKLIAVGENLKNKHQIVYYGIEYYANLYNIRLSMSSNSWICNSKLLSRLNIHHKRYREKLFMIIYELGNISKIHFWQATNSFRSTMWQ
jgi:hypothetical protein